MTDSHSCQDQELNVTSSQVNVLTYTPTDVALSHVGNNLIGIQFSHPSGSIPLTSPGNQTFALDPELAEKLLTLLEDALGARS